VEKSQGGWIYDPKPMDFCSENSIYTHPSISTDGKMIVFASDKTGLQEDWIYHNI